MKHKLIEAAVSLLYPSRCPLCEAILSGQERYVCSACSKALPWIRSGCLRCGRPVADETKEYCDQCLQETHAFTAGRSTFLYEGPLRDSVIRMKFKNHREYLDFYAAAMAESARSFLKAVHPAALIPVPMYRRKRAERGFDQVLELSERLSERTGIPVLKDAVFRTRGTKPQKGLDVRARRENVRGAFAVQKEKLPDGPVLLIDDIYTTGATIDALCGVLQEAGLHKLYFLTLCSAVRG